MVETLHLPTIQACQAYGIPRSYTASRANRRDEVAFLNGPQFNGMRINNTPSTVSNTNGDGDTARIDEIKLEFIGNQPYKMTFTPDNGIQKASFESGKDDVSILDVFIAPNTTDWINFTSKHAWEKPGGLITSLFESVTSLIGAGNGILTKILNATEGAGSDVKLRREQNIVLDQADSYKSSDNIEFTVPFLLWSAGNSIEDWIRDIYLPVMLLTAWSYPRRSRTLSALESSTSTETQPATSTDSADIQGKVQDFVNKIYPGTRITILDPPSYVRVSHTSGLFSFNRCAISSFNFKYLDPWVKATVPEGSYLNGMTETLLNKALPMRAECSITLRSIEKLYADDWISMYTSGLTTMGGTGSKVSVNISQTQNTNRQSSTNQQ